MNANDRYYDEERMQTLLLGRDLVPLMTVFTDSVVVASYYPQGYSWYALVLA